VIEEHTENLIPFNKLTKDEQRKIASNGGKRSVEVRKEKKLLSQMYADMLADEHDIDLDGVKQKVTGAELFKMVAQKIVSKGDSSSVSMMKEIREATEGSKVQQTGTIRQILVASKQDQEALEDDYALPE
jgi:hypothetical protein